MTSATCSSLVSGVRVAMGDEVARTRSAWASATIRLISCLVAPAVVDQIGDADHLDGRARVANRSSCGMRAIVPSSFMISQITAAGYRPASLARSTRRFGLSGAHEDAALASAQREDVARAGQVLRCVVGVERRLDRRRPVGRRDSGGDPGAGLDGDGEGRAQCVGVRPAPSSGCAARRGVLRSAAGRSGPARSGP